MGHDTGGDDSKRRTFLKAAGAVGIAGLAGCLGGGGDGGSNESGGTTGSDATPSGSGDTATEAGGTATEAGGTATEADGTTAADGDTATSGETQAGTETGTSASFDDETIRFVLNPAEANVAIIEQYQPMFDHIESETGVTIEPTRAESYTATLQALRNDQADIADVSPSATVAGEGVVDVIGRRIAYGASQYFSLITTTMDSGIEELSALEGETVSFADILSVSGTLVPLTMLQGAGLDTGTAPDGDPGNFEARYSDHATALEQMMGRPDIAAAGTGAFEAAPYVSQDQFQEVSQDFVDISAEFENAGSEGNELRLLSVSDPLPRAPLVARSNWESPARSAVENTILTATEDDLSHGENYEGEALWFTGVEEASMDDYQIIRDVLDQLGLEFSDITG